MLKTMRFLAVIAILVALVVACDGGTTRYHVTVSFNETVTQADMDSVGEYLRGFDDDLDFLIQESFPPTGVATLSTNAKEFCTTIEAELESRSYISSVDCSQVSDAPVESPDAPVSDEPDATAT